MEMKFDVLKREFHAAPTKETISRERMLKSTKNIAFLFLNAKMKEKNLQIGDVTKMFDREGKGVLNYDEFRAMVRWVEAKLNPSQISNIIKGK